MDILAQTHKKPKKKYIGRFRECLRLLRWERTARTVRGGVSRRALMLPCFVAQYTCGRFGIKTRWVWVF